MANFMYNKGKAAIMDGSIDLLTDTIKVMLINNTYTADPDNDYIDAGGANDPVDAELSGTGYVRKTLASKTVTEDDANNRAKFDAADLTWTAINAGTAAAAIIFKDTGVPTTSLLIAFIESGFPKTTNGGDLTIQWHADGIAYY